MERLRRAMLGTNVQVGQLVEMVHDNSRLQRVQEGLGRVSTVEYVSAGRARLTVKQTLGGSVVMSAEAVRRVEVENDVSRALRDQNGQNGQAPARVLVEPVTGARREARRICPAQSPKTPSPFNDSKAN
jgi:hypothetical protein